MDHIGIKCLSVPPEKSGITTISPELLESTWKKAERLLNKEGSICKAPGLVDAMCVASETATRPHFVSKLKNGIFACDESCIAWKSQKFCSHVLAVCEENQCLAEYISWYRSSKKKQSYTAALTHNQSKAVGKKPCDSRRKGSSSFKRPDIESSIDPLAYSSDLPKCSTPLVTMSYSPVTVTTTIQSLPVTQQPIVSANQIMQMNYAPQSVTSPFHSSPAAIPASHSANNLSPTVTSNQPFQIKFLTPSIKICAGCRGGYQRRPDGKHSLPPPNDLCLVHREQHLYYNVVNCKQQLSSLSNVHYHANTTCPRSRFPDFNPHSVEVPDDIKSKLQPEHWIFLTNTFRSTS